MSLEQQFANSKSSTSPLSQFQAQHKGDKFVHLKLYEKDMQYEVKRFPVNRDYSKSTKKGGTKQKISRYTKRSQQRMAHKIRNSTHLRNFLTLTYPGNYSQQSGGIVKRHLNNFLTQLRKKIPNVQYLWCLEVQPKRRAFHFHLILNESIPTENHYSEYWSSVWTRIVCDDEPPKDADFMDVYYWRQLQDPSNNHRSNHRSNHLKYGCRVDPITQNTPEKLAKYFSKYMSKNTQKNSSCYAGRWWGCSRGFTKPIVQGVYLLSEIKAVLRTCYRLVNAQRRKYNNEHELQLRKIKEDVGRGFCFWNIRGQFDSRLLKYFELILSNRVLELHSPPTLDEQGFCELIENFGLV